MEMRKLGSLEVTLVGLGCNNFGMRIDEERSAAVVHAALDAGINLFDTADVYGGTRSEQYLGRALAGRRDEAVVATKFVAPIDDDPSHAGAGARWVAEAVDGSLRRLGTDRIDLYQQHGPDPSVPIEETLTALDRLVRDGKVREIGNSNFSGEQIDEAESVSERPRPVRECAESLQPAAPGAFALRRPGLRSGRSRRPAVLPARERTPDREIPAGRARARGHAAVAASRGARGARDV
jgi:aryl-alcohol dehydrogenase-like predicted oxidoreductase